MLTSTMEFIDRHLVVRRLTLAWMCGITSWAMLWTMDFAAASPRSGIDVAAIIGAIWVPLSALQGAVIAFYNSARNP